MSILSKRIFNKIKKKSSRKILREKIGKIHLEILRIKRGNRDELSGDQNVVLGRFHILPVGLYPKLEFVDDNILLVVWFGGKTLTPRLASRLF